MHLIKPVIFAFILAPGLALADAPPGSDPASPLARWAKSLKTPPIRHNFASEDGDVKDRVYRESCCGIDSDCRPTLMRITDQNAVQVWVDTDTYGSTAPDDWVTVPRDVLENTESSGPPPDNHVWACWYDKKVRCFIAPWSD